MNALVWRDRQVPVFQGQHDSQIRTGADYETISLEGIFDLEPTALPKAQALAFIPSTYCEHDGRNYSVQRERGKFTCITIDVDHGDHSLMHVRDEVKQLVAGSAWLIYSSAHSRPYNRRWRVLVPLVDPLDFEDWHDAQEAVFSCLAREGIKCDRALSRAAQPVYLPNVPALHAESGADLRGSDGLPLYYDRARSALDAPGFDIGSGPIATEIQAIRCRRKADEAERSRIREEATKRNTRRPISTGDGGSMIDVFNQENPVDSMLERYGYKRSPRHGGDWRSPMQTSDSYATRVIEGGKWISLSASDASAGVGKLCNSGCFGDGFDLFMYFEHGGDRKAALRELHRERKAAQSLDLGRQAEETFSPPNVQSELPHIATPERAQAPGNIKATPFSWPKPADIPRRRWLFERWLLRGEITGVIAPTGVGKSTITTAIALSLASGQAFLDRSLPEGACTAWLWNLEDDRDELDRQVIACSLQHGIGRKECGNRIYLDSGLEQGLCTAIEEAGNFKIIEPVYESLRTEINSRGIDVLIIDPFVSSHEVDENKNVLIDKIAKRWKRLAQATDCAIVLVIHTRKMGGREVKAEDSRGAVSLIAAARIALTLNVMSAEEGERFGINEKKELRAMVRIDNDKTNRSPAENAVWFKKVSVDLGNGDGLHPSDHVGAAIPWSPPDPFEGITDHDLYEVQLRVKDGEFGENCQASDWAGYTVAEVIGGDPKNDRADKARIKSLLKQWIANGAFRVVRMDSQKGRDRPMLVVKNMVDLSTTHTS